MKNSARMGAAISTSLLILSGCVTTGMGSGEMSPAGKPSEPVHFSWKSSDGGNSGSITANLPGATYTGQFFQITRQTARETLGPMWDGWNEGWSDWPYWTQPWPSDYNVTQFITNYSGKVVANLHTRTGQYMRCRFHLADPVSGMSGGGQGECQLSGGRVINADFGHN